jgi:glycosyltransferase involved in cell wall biosynthesis
MASLISKTTARSQILFRRPSRLTLRLSLANILPLMPRRMKICLALEYPLAQPGGTEVLVTELIHGLSAHHQILLVSPDDASSLARSPVANCVSEHISWTTEPASAARSRKLAQQIAAAKPDLVHFHFGGNYAWKNRAFTQCPVVHVARAGLRVLSTNHGAFSIFEGYCWSERNFLVKLALLPAAWLSKQYVLAHLATEVAVSQNDFHALRRWYPPLAKKFRWLYHSRIRETTPPSFNPAREKIILCAGTVGARKGQTFLVEAFARVAKKFPDWQLVFLGREGDAAMMSRVRALITEHQIAHQVQLLGACSDAELRDWLGRAAIFCIPSLYEGLGLSLQEAQFHGCACIGTRCGGVEDLIQDGDNGLLVPAGQVAPLADALEKLMADPALREQFSRRAPQSVLEKNMTAAKMVAAYEKLYAEILNPPA